MNHACEPNCAATEDAGRVFIHGLREIRTREELSLTTAASRRGCR
ncbi:SET domain-containing protein-lysine N-methyltransferase [Paraburkholderia fungorum]